jgi:hypothetical protein
LLGGRLNHLASLIEEINPLRYFGIDPTEKSQNLKEFLPIVKNRPDAVLGFNATTASGL